ncbi:protein root UVB sensitive 4 isoform X4 [Beta vulgaris subsp. vulgaris]|uniref:protein root UVB sensitive 4 isoform X4 n=1 Tax=Beta vulgaris subsp. vulgaris TaxID=3555 RepID=UPI0020369523|nr:protein root UVB sensitive 4 isoform X4 [Beta vulgaris subsp. vulgaris]
MQSSSTISLNSQSLQFSWKPSLPRNFSLQTFNSNPTSQFKTFSLFTSFKTLPNSDSQQPIIKKNQSLSKTDLPVVIRRNGKDFKYFWDGNSLELVCVDDEIPTTLFESFEEGIKKFLTVVRDFFIPKQVTENYIEYVKWKFLHRVFSSSLQVLATQAMFRAIGVGYAQSLPSAAAMNWVLKDGLGRLSRCIYTSCVGSAFDTNLKTAVHRSFALADNLGEVSAKAQIQTVCFDNLGLLLAASINVVLKNNERLQAGLPFVVYPIFSAIDLCGIYQSLKHVHLQTFTKDRLELVLDKWIQSGYVPSPAEVSKLEGIDLLNFVDEVETGRKKGEWPIRIGGLDPKRQIPLLTMLTMRSLSREDFYFICLETTCGLPSEKQGILLSLREGARTEDIIVGLLQACYIRHALLPSSSKWENIVEDCDISHSKAMKWFQLTQDSKSLAQLDLSTLHEQMLSSSWIAKNILLGTQEQTRYDFVDKNDV